MAVCCVLILWEKHGKFVGKTWEIYGKKSMENSDMIVS